MGRPSFRARTVLHSFWLSVPGLCVLAACSSTPTTAPAGSNGTGFGDAATGNHDATTVVKHPHKDGGTKPKADAHHADAEKADATGDAKSDVQSDAKADAKPDAKADTGVDAKTGDAKADSDASKLDTGVDALPFTDAKTGANCTLPGECASGVCAPGPVLVGDGGFAPDAGNCAEHSVCTCQQPSCFDGVKNGDETGVDCGGSCADQMARTGICSDGVGCNIGTDCKSQVCGGAGHDGGPGGVCQAPTCSDGVQNGKETDIDCGSSTICPPGEVCPTCNGCTTGEACNASMDCISNICSASPTGGNLCGCPSGMTEASTNVGIPYCIDSVEVTFQEYENFLNQSVSVASQPAQCLPWNQSFEPQQIGALPGMNEPAYTNPVTNVNWCDAFMYCANTKPSGVTTNVTKHLCGTISSTRGVPGGSEVPFRGTGPNNEGVDEWYNACSLQGANAYPYGNTYKPIQCNGIDSPPQNPSPSYGNPTGTVHPPAQPGYTLAGGQCGLFVPDPDPCGTLATCCSKLSGEAYTECMGGAGPAVPGADFSTVGPAALSPYFPDGGTPHWLDGGLPDADIDCGIPPLPQDAGASLDAYAPPYGDAAARVAWLQTHSDAAASCVAEADRHILCTQQLENNIAYGVCQTPPAEIVANVDCTPVTGSCNSPPNPYQTVGAGQVVNGETLAPSPGATPSCGEVYVQSSCEGLIAGLFDMSGNVAEWENSCSADNGPGDLCNIRGGSFDSPNGDLSLQCPTSIEQAPMARDTVALDIGFRCCL